MELQGFNQCCVYNVTGTIPSVFWQGDAPTGHGVCQGSAVVFWSGVYNKVVFGYFLHKARYGFDNNNTLLCVEEFKEPHIVMPLTFTSGTPPDDMFEPLDINHCYTSGC